MAYLQKKNYMFQHVVELHVVEMTCKNLHDSETPVMLRIRIWMGGEGGETWDKNEKTKWVAFNNKVNSNKS